MADEEIVHIRGEGGAVFAMALPLQRDIAKRLARGHLRQVNPDGTPLAGSGAVDEPAAPAAAERPAQSASKADWVSYAVRSLQLSPEDAEAYTKQDLIDLADEA